MSLPYYGSGIVGLPLVGALNYPALGTLGISYTNYLGTGLNPYYDNNYNYGYIGNNYGYTGNNYGNQNQAGNEYNNVYMYSNCNHLGYPYGRRY